MPDGVTPVTDNTALWDSNGNWLPPSGQLRHQLQGHPELDREHRAQSVPVAIAIGKHPVLQRDSDRRAGRRLQPHRCSTRRSPTRTSDSGRSTSTSCSACGAIRTATCRRPAARRAAMGRTLPAATATAVSISGPDTGTKYNGIAFVAPTDNPLRPRHRFWFGPMTMIQYMLDTSISPGTFHDISMVPAKLGIAGAITDIQNNHPNDMVSMIYYARPSYAGEPQHRGHVRQPDQLAGPQLHQHDQFALVSAQQRQRGRPALGRQRQPDAARSRRLRQQHGHQLRADAGLQPVQRQHRACKARAWAATAAKAPSGW